MPHPEKNTENASFFGTPNRHSPKRYGNHICPLPVGIGMAGILLAWLLPVQNWSPGLKSDILHGNTGLCPFRQGRNLPLHRISVAVAQVLFYHIPASISIVGVSFFYRFMQRTFPFRSVLFCDNCTKEGGVFTKSNFFQEYHSTILKRQKKKALPKQSFLYFIIRRCLPRTSRCRQRS